MSSQDRRVVAYWYPEPFWNDAEGSGVKNLLPFFDEVAILLPDYMYGRHRDANPWLTGPLEEMGLLRVLEPGQFIDGSMTQRLHAILDGLLEAGAFDDLEIPNGRYGYHELSQTRLGWNADVKLASAFVERLEALGLALPSESGVFVPLHPVVRTTVLVLLSQLAPGVARQAGIELLPVTADAERVRDLVRVLKLPGVASAGQVVALDIETVGVDLSQVPLDDVLGFRDAHGAAYRSYARAVREFVRGLSPLPEAEREEAVVDRQEELSDLASDLRNVSRSYWRRPLARVALGGAGALLSLKLGSPLPAGLAGMTALLEWEKRSDDAGPFSYLFEVRRSLT